MLVFWSPVPFREWIKIQILLCNISVCAYAPMFVNITFVFTRVKKAATKTNVCICVCAYVRMHHVHHGQVYLFPVLGNPCPHVVSHYITTVATSRLSLNLWLRIFCFSTVDKWPLLSSELPWLQWMNVFLVTTLCSTCEHTALSVLWEVVYAHAGVKEICWKTEGKNISHSNFLGLYFVKVFITQFSLINALILGG